MLGIDHQRAGIGAIEPGAKYRRFWKVVGKSDSRGRIERKFANG